jgi:SAM-dependent methyltransferase
VRPDGSPSTEQIRERQRREWTDAGTVAAWRHWRALSAGHLASLTEVLASAADVREGQRVLDIASGAGEPALTLARRVGTSGRVTASDLGTGMLSIIEDAAHEAGLRNIDFAVADVHSLPFGDASYDRVTCRLGAMFFVDVPRALSECRRVLKPGRTIALLVWGDLHKNGFFAPAMAALGARVSLPVPAPGVPTPSRFAIPGSLSAELEGVGFHDVTEQRLVVQTPWPGSPEELWRHFHDAVPSMRRLAEGLRAAEREALAREVIEAYRARYDGEQVALSAEVVVVSATR